jgi:hypothetical protein
MQENDEKSKEIIQFLDEIAARSKTETAAEMRAHLLAFSKIRSVLSKLELKGIQVLEPDSIERYEVDLSERKAAKSALDFVLRKENVEIQLEVKYREGKDISLSIQDLRQYYEVLSNNSKTEEILVTWVGEELPTLALNLAQLQKYISKGNQISVEASSLKKLEEAAMVAFDRHMPDWYKAVKIAPGKGVRYDPKQLFVESLTANVVKIKEMAETRRYADRKQVSESITEQDVRSLVQIYDEGLAGKLTPERIEEKLKQIASWNSTAMQ